MRKSRRNLPKRGGKFLGEGTYGCGFSPPLKCKGEATRRNASKLTKMLISRPEADKEYAESRRILQIDPQRNYFLTADGFCEHDQTNIRKENETSKCKKFPLTAPSFLVFYEMGGQNLQEIKIPVNLYWNFFRSFTGLLRGLALLHKGGMVHLDIKPPNIVSKVSPRGSYLTRYIDFGLSSRISELNPSSHHLTNLAWFQDEQIYPWYPIDMIFGCEDFQPVDYFEFTDKYINRWYSRMGYEKYTIPMDFYYNEDGTPKLNAAEMSKELDLNFYKDTASFVKSVDCYSICVSLCQVYSRMTGHYYGLDKNSMPTIFFNKFFTIDDLPELGLNDTSIEFHRDLSEFSLKFYNIMKLGVHWNGTLRATAEALAEMLTDLFATTSFNPFADADLAFIALQPLASVLAPVKVGQLLKHQEGKRQLVESRPMNIPKLNIPKENSSKQDPTVSIASKLPTGWEELQNTNGTPYYYNPNLDHTQWAKPVAGWIEHFNENTKKSYWENLKTHKTRWNHPKIPPKTRKNRIQTMVVPTQPQAIPQALPVAKPTQAKKVVIKRNPLANLALQEARDRNATKKKLHPNNRVGRFQLDPAFGF